MLFAHVHGARAETLLYEFSSILDGDAPASAAPWGTLSFADQSGDVLMTLSIDADFAGNMKELYFNFAGAAGTSAELHALEFQLLDGVGATSIDRGLNQFKADGDGYHDLLFSYTSGGGFEGGDSSVYLITSSLGITASMFDSKSLPGGGNGVWHAVLHAQNVDGPGTDSAWIGATPIPEPQSYALLLAGLGLLGFIAGRGRKHISA